MFSTFLPTAEKKLLIYAMVLSFSFLLSLFHSFYPSFFLRISISIPHQLPFFCGGIFVIANCDDDIENNGQEEGEVEK